MMHWESRRTAVMCVAAIVGLMALIRFSGYSANAENARPLPVAAIDEAVGERTSESAILAGGCFWGVQGVFQHVQGVTGAVSGYAGGSKAGANYEEVSAGRTGHAEAVQVTFDPRVISYGRLLQVYFSVAHDPTQLNQQGPDRGVQYRSAIFPTSDEQARVAQAYIAQLNAAASFTRPIVTAIQTGSAFYPAERYHQNYLTNHPTDPYIAINDIPKLHELKRLMPEVYRAEPLLVDVTAPTHQ